MKLVIQNDGVNHEVKEALLIDKDAETIIFFLMTNFRPGNLEEMENNLAERLGKKVIILGPAFKETVISI